MSISVPASVPDLREPYINKLRYIIGTFDWSHLFCADDDIDVMYCNFLTILHFIIDECIPRKYVVVGPRDPDFVTPLVKMLLKKGTDCVDLAELMQPMMSLTHSLLRLTSWGS